MKIGDYVNIIATDEQFKKLGHENPSTIKQLRKNGGIITGMVRPKTKRNSERSWVVNRMFTFPESILEVRKLKEEEGNKEHEFEVEINPNKERNELNMKITGTAKKIKSENENLQDNEQNPESERNND